jgi:hypothetical protein
LLADLGTMAKSMGSDPEKAEVKEARKDEKHMQHGTSMAKSEAERKKEEEEEEERKKKEGKGGKEEKSEPMTKSFSLQTQDGKQIEVIDASDLIKSLGDRLDGSVQQIFDTLQGAADVIKTQGTMLKSLSDKLAATETALTEQSTLVKSLQDSVKEIGSAPAGRKAVLTVAERQTGTATDTMAKSGMPEGVSPDAFFAKAFAKQAEGKLTGVDISLAESCLNRGAPIPESIVTRVMS